MSKSQKIKQQSAPLHHSPPRPPQQDRSAETRKKLLQETLNCLVKNGARGTTTDEIAKRAGVTRGAYRHHFGTRETLFIEASMYAQDLFLKDFERAFLPMDKKARFENAFECFWSADTSGRFLALLELMVLARSDELIRAAWLDQAAHFTMRRKEVFEFIFGKKAMCHPEFLDYLEGLLDVIRGLNLIQSANTPARFRQRKKYWSKASRKQMLAFYDEIEGK